jgi:hypothetical protein
MKRTDERRCTRYILPVHVNRYECRRGSEISVANLLNTRAPGLTHHSGATVQGEEGTGFIARLAFSLSNPTLTITNYGTAACSKQTVYVALS